MLGAGHLEKLPTTFMETILIDSEQLEALTSSLELVARCVCLVFGALLHIQFALIFKPYR
jgi:hypothetical protein